MPAATAKGTIYSVKTEDGAATVIYQTGTERGTQACYGGTGVNLCREPLRQQHHSPADRPRLPVLRLPEVVAFRGKEVEGL